MSRKALGRGLEALIPGSDSTRAAVEPPSSPVAPRKEESTAGPTLVPLDRIRRNPYQPRTEFDPASLKELTQSIRENGLIQPLVVRAAEDGGFELIAGERRFLACREAGLSEAPVVVRRAGRREMLEVALVENLQREDLNPIEEAEAYQRLAAEFGLTQEAIAGRVGRSRTAVTNAMRLLSLPEDLREMVSTGALTAGHARALLALPDDASRRRLAREIVGKALSVRQTEARVEGSRPRARAAARKRSHPALEVYEDRLRDRFGTQVRIVGGTGRGRLEIHYFNDEDLERVLSLVGVDARL